MTHRVLVTRSQPGADATAAKLRDRGIEPVIEPLIAIEAIAAETPAFDALAFTSLNGVRRFREISAWRDGPVWCVGDRTAAEARDSGYHDVRSADGSVEDLTEMLLRELPPEAALLHAGNEESRGDLAGELQRSGRTASFLPIYRSVELDTPPPALAQALAEPDAVACVLIHSPKGARVLARLARELDSPSLKVATISLNASNELAGLDAEIETAARPTEDELLNAMDRLLSGS